MGMADLTMIMLCGVVTWLMRVLDGLGRWESVGRNPLPHSGESCYVAGLVLMGWARTMRCRGR